MGEQPAIYGLDVTTSATGPFVDPTTDRIVAIGLSSSGADEYFDGNETDLLSDLEERLGLLAPGVIATWDGSVLALPLLAARARHCSVPLSLRLQSDRRAAPPSPVRGVDQPVRGRWGDHQILDLRRVYEPGRRWGLLGRGRDREDLIPPTDELAPHDPCSDARLARRLAERRWPQARRHLDTLTESADAFTPTLG